MNIFDVAFEHFFCIMIQRVEIKELIRRLNEPRKFIQVIVGPRQVGKTTMVTQAVEQIAIPHLFFSADNIFASNDWLAEKWQSARLMVQMQGLEQLVLVIDEVQKIPNWSECIKKEWDLDTFNHIPIKLVLLGSSRLMIMNGLTESLAGRFELVRMTHWTFAEMRDGFGWDLDTFIYYGGYPGASEMITDENRWRNYVENAILEASINKDVLQTSNVYKPALLRQLFTLCCAYSGKELSYRKMLGSLQEAGNATTLANYLQLLAEANLVSGLQKYARDNARKYSSTPKLQVFDNALMNVYNQTTFASVRTDATLWGRQVESAVGSYLLSQAEKHRMQVYYWRENNAEVDFVLQRGMAVVAIEVKSNNARTNAGLHLFDNKYKPLRAFVVGNEGIPVADFLQMDIQGLFR